LAGKIVHHSDLAVSAWGYGLGRFLAGHEIPGHIPSPLAIHWPSIFFGLPSGDFKQNIADSTMCHANYTTAMVAMANPSMRLITVDQPHGWVCHG